jgi:hypothetical protein
MSTLSTKLQLKLNDGSDPFLRSDFTSNWGILDGSPGNYICTSDTKPTWGSGQAGRRIFLTDEKRAQYWDGSAFQEERASTPFFAGGAVFNATISKNSAPLYSVLTFTTGRPCSIMVIMNATMSCDSQHTQSVGLRVNYDGADQLMGAYTDNTRFTGNTSDTTSDAQITTSAIAGVATVSKGAHTIRAKIITGTYNTSVVLNGVKLFVIMGLYNGSQSL